MKKLSYKPYEPGIGDLAGIGFRSCGTGNENAAIGATAGWSIYYAPANKFPFSAYDGRHGVRLHIRSKADLVAAIRIFGIETESGASEK